MRPECGEQNTTGVSCSSGRSSANGGVSSARMEARSLACMSGRASLTHCGTIARAAVRGMRRDGDWPASGSRFDFAKRRRPCPHGHGSSPRQPSCTAHPCYFIARLPNWRQIPRASRLGRSVALRRGPEAFIPFWAVDAVMTAKPSRLPAKRILLAEDDDSMRGFLERALAKAGYEVIAFANGMEAFERLREEPFSLLLTDIVMPQMDGIELARRASELAPEIKIMFITGFAAVTLNTNSRPPKDARVLSKPFHLKDLVREIDRLLAA